MSAEHTCHAAMQAMIAREDRIASAENGRFREAVASVLSAIEPIAHAHAAFLEGLLACPFLEASVAHLSSHLQRVAPLYARFLADFDASFALAGHLLIEHRASGDDKCFAIDAFVEPVRHIETYRSIVRILRDATPEAHGSLRSMIVQAGHLAHALPVPPCAAEDLVKLRRLSRCLVPDPSSLSPSSNAIHDPQYRAIFSLIRLDRKTIKEGTLHLTALRGQSTIFARAGFGPSTPVVVVLLSDIFLILTQCSFGMRVHEKCELRSSSIEPSSSKDSQKLTVWCAGVRHVLLAASPDERRAWAQLLQITISSACEAAARTPLQVVAPVSRTYPVGIKHGPPMMFAGPTPKNKSGIGDAAHAIDFAYMNMIGGNASTSDGEFEWETDDEEEHVSHERGEGGETNEKGNGMLSDGPANGVQPPVSSLIHELTAVSEFTAEWYPEAGRLQLARLRPVGGWARVGRQDYSLTCSRGQTRHDGETSMRIMSRSGKWAWAGDSDANIGGVLQGLLIENSRDRHRPPSSARSTRAWRILVPGLPPVATVRIDTALSPKNGFNLHVEVDCGMDDKEQAQASFVGTSSLADASHTPAGTTCLVLFHQASGKRVLLATLVDAMPHPHSSSHNRTRQPTTLNVTVERHLSVFHAFSIMSAACFSLPQVAELGSPSSSTLALQSALVSATSSSACLADNGSEPSTAAHLTPAVRQRETEGIFQEHMLEELGERLGTQL